MNLEDKLKEKFGNQNPFSVPENYFDDFANKMQDLVKEESPVYRMEVQSDRRTRLLKSSHTFIWRQCSAVCISELMS